MTYAPYPAYKPSGVSWLGDIPVGWDVRKLTHSLKYQVGFTPESGNENYYGEGYDWANISDLKQKFLISTEKQITQEAVDKYRKPPAPKGSLLYSFKLSVGLVSIANTDIYTNEAIAAFLPGKYYDLRYLYYLAPLGIIQYASENIYGAKILNQEAIGGARLPTPSIPEQQAIASFLDAKTAEIDALIAKKEALLALLAEQRAALITQAVTKGLNPDVQTRPSGISWLGDIPVGWEVKRLRHIGKPIIGLTYSPDDITTEAEGTLVLRSGNVQGGKISLEDNVYVSSEIPEKLRTRIGDILICSRNGSRALIGKNARIDKDSAGQTFGAFMTVLRSEYGDFLYWVFNSSLFAYQAGKFLTTTINQLTTSTFNDIETPFPPKKEQLQIAAFLDSKTMEMDLIKSRVEVAISNLKEYRTALITNAVTGKIRVD